MKPVLGVDSRIPANERLTNGYQMYDWVMRMSGIPSFWGRAISGVGALSTEEADFLHGKDCKVALIYDDLTEEGVSTVDGTSDALRAIDAAKALCVPENEGIALFAEIKHDWSVNHNWMIGYTYALTGVGYIAGFIGNTDSSKNFNFGRQCSHYVQFMGADSAVYWATEPRPGDEPMGWHPYSPSALDPGQIHLWQNGGEILFRGISVNVDYARDHTVLQYMW